MAKFYAAIQAKGTEVTRLGHNGIKTITASWHGAIYTELYERDGQVYALVQLLSWPDRSVLQTVLHERLSNGE